MTTIDFFDDSLIHARLDVARRIHPPRKHAGNPVIPAERDWEGNGSAFYWPTVLYDEEERLFKVWYDAINGSEGIGCYAVSVDGIRWERPELGLFRWKGSKRNNIFHRGTYRRGPGAPICPCVVKRAPGDWHMYYWDAPRAGGPAGVMHYVGEDGIRWRPGRRNPVAQTPVDRTHSGGVSDVLRASYDPIGKQVVLSVRTLPFENLEEPRRQKAVPGGMSQRRVAIAISADGERFSPLRTAITPESNDPWDLQLYGMSPFRHGAGFLGHLLCYRTGAPKMDVELAWSRDAVSWQRVAPNVPYIPTGGRGRPDCGLIHCANAPVRVGDKLYVYYMGSNSNHAGGTVDGKAGSAALCLAVAEADRMVSIHTPHKKGSLLIGPVRMGSEGVRLNAEARGGIVVALRDARTFAELRGHGLAECDRIVGDSREHTVTWRGRAQTVALRGRKVFVQVRMEEAELYSVKVV